MKHRPLKFHATCRLKVDKPLGALCDDDRAVMEAKDIRSRWDRRRTLEVVAIPCDFETHDAAEFEEHMLEVHGRKPARNQIWRGSTNPAPLLVPPVKMWQGPRPAPEGTPFKASTKDTAERVKTCSGCGLVAEVSGDTSSVLWWDEHLRMCVDRKDDPDHRITVTPMEVFGRVLLECTCGISQRYASMPAANASMPAANAAGLRHEEQAS